MKKSGIFVSVIAGAVLLGCFTQLARADKPSMPCRSGTNIVKAFLGHMEKYKFQNGLVTQEQSYFKVDNEVKPTNGCYIDIPAPPAGPPGSCALIVLNQPPDATSTSDLNLTCVKESDTSVTGWTPSADYRRIKPVCPTKGAVGCSENTTDLGAKANEFFEGLAKQKQIGYFGCVYPADSTREVGKWFCSAGTNKDKNKSLFQLGADRPAHH